MNLAKMFTLVVLLEKCGGQSLNWQVCARMAKIDKSQNWQVCARTAKTWRHMMSCTGVALTWLTWLHVSQTNVQLN
jgi:hypothetical protein